MMFAQSIFTIALLALSANVASATPPACLLGAVNTQPNPANLAGICGSNAAKVQHEIQSACGPNTAAAMKAFSSICAAAGHHVAAPKTHVKPTATKHNSHMVRPTKHTRPTEHSMPHRPQSKQTPHHTQSAAHGSNTQHVVHHEPAATGGSTGTNRAAVQTPSSTPTSQNKPYDGAAGHLGANAFGALAMAAAGLAILL